MAPFLFLAFALFLVGDSVADRISGGYYVDWEAKANELATGWTQYYVPLFNQERPGEIIPGLSVQDVISTAGKAWYETEMREVFGLICRDIAPALAVPFGAPFISGLCDPVFHSLNTNTRIDGRAICNGVYDHMGLAYSARRRRRRMAEGESMLGLDFNFAKVGEDIARRIFHLDGYDQESICTAFDNFVNSEISTQRLVKDVGEIVMEEAIAKGSLICQNWDAVYENVRLFDQQSGGYEPYFFTNLIDHAPRLIAQAIGYENREALCDTLVEVSPPVNQTHSHESGAQHAGDVSALADSILQNMWHTLTITAQCNQMANDAINALLDFDLFYIHGRDGINQDVQRVFDLQSMEETCAFVHSTFTFTVCDIDTCVNGGSCEEFHDIFGLSFRCHCESGYVGTDCGIEIQ